MVCLAEDKAAVLRPQRVMAALARRQRDGGAAAAAYGVAKLRTLRSSPHGVHSSVVHVCAHSVRLTEKGRSVAFAEQTASVEAAPLLHFTKSY